MKRLLFPLLALCLAASPCQAITIQLRYDYDTTGFFNKPGAKAALQAVANYYQTLLNDSLTEINPAKSGYDWVASFAHPAAGAMQSLPNLVVPADTIIVFVGSRSVYPASAQGGPGGYSASGSQGWLDQIRGRGQSGALASPATDFAPWGGVITFDSVVTWSFSTTGPVDGATDFIPAAMHEFGHVLGIGTADSWFAKVSGSNFTGAAARAAFGGKVVPLESDGGHWQDDGVCQSPDGYSPTNRLNVLSKAYGAFGALHGYAQIALMDPSLCSAGPFLKVMTDLDLAALRDIGWQLGPPARWQSFQVQTSPFTFTWPSTTGTTYRVETSTNLTNWTALTTKAGDGTIQQFSVANPGGAALFYRLNTGGASSAASLIPSAAGATSQAIHTESHDPVDVKGCRFGSSFGQQQ